MLFVYINNNTEKYMRKAYIEWMKIAGNLDKYFQ